MYIFTPKRQNAFGIILSAVFLTCGVFFLATSTSKQNGLSSFFYIAPVMLLIGTVIAARYVFCTYEYIIDINKNTFTVKEKRFKKSAVTARILISEIDETVCVEKRRKAKKSKNDAPKKVYDYRPDIFPKKYQVIISKSPNYCDEGGEMHLLVCLDKKALSMLSEK